MLYFAADAMSFVRIPFTLLLLGVSFQQDWKLGLAILILAWLTDLIDGILARGFGSWSKDRNLDADGISDTVLALGSTFVPVIYAWFNYTSMAFLSLAALYLLTVISCIAMASKRKDKSPLASQLIRWNMIVFHAIIQIGGTFAWFAYMALGWDGVLMVVFGGVALACNQSPKIRSWWDGQLVVAPKAG